MSNSTSAKIYKFYVNGFHYEVVLDVTNTVMQKMDNSKISGLVQAIALTIERRVAEFYTSPTYHQGNVGLVKHLSSDLTYNFPTVSSLGRSTFSLVQPDVALGLITSILMEVADPEEATYYVPSDREPRDTNDPFPLIFADCFDKLWKRANAAGLTTSSMDIEKVCSIIEAVAFGVEATKGS